MEPAASVSSMGSRGEGRRGGHTTRVDKGWAWVVMAAFLVNCFLRIGYFKSFGIIFLELLRTFNDSVAATAVVVGFIAVGFSVGGYLTLTVFMPTMTVRKCIILGGLVTFAGVILTITASNLAAVVVTLGFLVGFGHVVLYLPGQTLMALYFRKYRSLAIHVVNVGAGFGAVAFPPLFHFLIAKYGLNGCLLIVSGILLNAVVCGALMRPPGLKEDVCIEEALLEEHMKEGEILGCDVLIGDPSEPVKPNGTAPNGYMGTRRESQTAMVLQEIEKDVRNLEPILEKVPLNDPVIPVQQHYSTVPNSPFDGVTTVNVAPICSTGEVKRNDSAPTIGNNVDKDLDLGQEFNFSDFLDSKAVVDISKMKFEVGGDDDDDDDDDGADNSKVAPIPSTSVTPALPPTIVVEDTDAPATCKASELAPLLIPDEDAIRVLDGMSPDKVPLTPKSIKEEPEGTKIAALCILADPSLPVTSLATAASHGMKFHGSAPALGMAAFEVVDVVDATGLMPGQAAKKQEEAEEGCWDKIVAKQNLDATLFREPLFYVLLSQALLALLPTNLMLNFLPALAWERGLSDLQHALLLMLVAACSIVAKVITGLLLEHRRVRASSIQVMSMLVMGVAGVLVPLCTHFWMFLIFAAGFGFVADIYYGLVALLAEEFFGAERLDNVILLTILFEGVFLAVGSPLCGLIRDCTGSFDAVYYCLGGFALLAGLVLIVQRCVPSKTVHQVVHSDVNGKATPAPV